MTDPHKAIITQDEELYHLQYVEDADDEATEFTKWLLGDEWDDEINSTQEVRH